MTDWRIKFCIFCFTFELLLFTSYFLPLTLDLILLTFYFGPLTFDLLLWTSYFWPLTFDLLLSTTYYGPLTFDHLLCTSYYVPLTFDLLLLTSYFGPLTFDLLLSTSYFWLLTPYPLPLTPLPYSWQRPTPLYPDLTHPNHQNQLCSYLESLYSVSIWFVARIVNCFIIYFYGFLYFFFLIFIRYDED